MPAVEIDEVELQSLKTLQNTVGAMLKHPAARKKILQAQKDVDPNAKIPELDTPDPVEQRLEEQNKQLTALQKQIADDKAEREKNDKLNSLRSQHEAGIAALRRDGWTDDGIKGVEKIMEDKGILDPAIAAAYYEKQHPPQAPVTPGGSGAWNFMDMPADGEADLKKLIETKGESPALLDKMARDALSDFRGSQRR